MAKKYHGEQKFKGKGFANMPEEKVMKEYPKAEYGGPEDYKDNINGIDMLAKDNHKQMMKHKGGRY